MTETEKDNGPKDESNDGDDLDLDAALDALDLDTNFLESGEFQNDDEAAAGETQEAKKEEGEPRTTTPPPPTVPESASHESHTMSTHHWKNRPEIYSRHFKPDPSERAQLEKVAALMGVKSGLKGAPGSKSLVGNLLGGSDNMDTSESDVSHDPQSQWNRLVSGKGTQQTQNLPVSIILYQGTVLYKDYDEATQQPVAHHGCELLLLTRGFLLFQREVKQKSGIGSLFGGGNKTEDILSPLGSSLWTDVRQIQTTNQQSLLLKCGGTNPDDQVSFEIMPTGGDNLVEWRSIIQAAATSAHLNFVTDSRSDSHDERGWQHRLCHTPWFTEAVTGEWEAQEEEGQEMTTSDSAVSGLDALDEYHSYAPLHYATRANHVDIMQRLLEAGANPNIEDGEGKTPMYYAQRDELPLATIQVLEQYGATKSKKAEEEMRGELFGKVADTEKARDIKREEKEKEAAKVAEEKAQAAQAQMSKNLAAMQNRGERIEELGDKATEMNDGAREYGDMAAQLKEKMKKKSKWGF